MDEKKIAELLESCAEKAAKKVVKEELAAGAQNFMSLEKKTELYLKNFKEYELLIHDKQMEIVELNRNNIRTSSIMTTNKNGIMSEFESEYEKKHKKIKALEAQIIEMSVIVDSVNSVIEKFKNDPNFELVEEYYFNNTSYSMIAKQFCMTRTEVVRTIEKLFERIKNYLFMDNMIYVV